MKRGWKLCLAGLVGYPALELCYRGRTHWSMALAGALTLPCLSRLACRRELSLLRRSLRGALFITGVELVFGLVFNLGLKQQVWSYRQRRYNLWGQICPLASLRWYLLCLLLMPALGR